MIVSYSGDGGVMRVVMVCSGGDEGCGNDSDGDAGDDDDNDGDGDDDGGSDVYRE